MYDYNPTPAETRGAMQVLRDAGVTIAKIGFSGGNDEGGADGIDYFDAEGTLVTMPSSNAYNESGSRYDPATGKFVQVDPRWVVHGPWVAGQPADKRDATPDEIAVAKVVAVLEAPIYDRWGSFAGEFYVQGTLTWDVTTGKHTLEGQESHEVWESF